MTIFEKNNKNNIPVNLHHFDSTKMRTWKSCERRFAYEYVLGLRPKNSNVHLVWGTSMHAALAHFFQNINHDKKKAVSESIDVFDHWWTKHYALGDTLPEQKHKNRMGAIKALAAFVGEKQIWENMDVHSIEYMFRGKNNFVGMLDILHKDHKYPERGLMFCDIKTRGGYASDRWFRDYSTGIQMGMYSHILREIFPKEVPYKGVYFSIIGLFANGSLSPEKLVQKRSFFWDRRDLKSITETLNNTKKQMSAKISYSVRKNTLRNMLRSPDSCSFCPFHDMCFRLIDPASIDQEYLDEFLPGVEENHWNVLKQH